MKSIAIKPRALSPGLGFVATLAGASYLISQFDWLSHLGMSPLIIAIIFGIFVSNTMTLPTSLHQGIQFSAKRLLRLAIILYGFRVTLQQITAIGTEAFLIDSTVVIATLAVGYLVGTKLLHLDKHLALLISAGAAICGAAAVLAVEDILKSEPHKAAIAVGTVVLFGTLSMFVYPLLQQAQVLGFDNHQFGLFAGASIHEVAQVLAAGSNISADTGNTAVVVKMIRVLLLVPVLFLLATLSQHRTSTSHNQRIIIPWFALGFVVVIGFHSLQLLPPTTVANINFIDTLLLTMAMCAIGLETKFAKIKHVGMTPFYLASILFCWLFASVFLMVRFF